MPDQPPSRYVIHVQPTDLGANNDYEIGETYTPSVVTTDDRELWITKTEEGLSTTARLVAVYAQGTWLRCWMEDRDATDA